MQREGLVLFLSVRPSQIFRSTALDRSRQVLHSGLGAPRRTRQKQRLPRSWTSVPEGRGGHRLPTGTRALVIGRRGEGGRRAGHVSKTRRLRKNQPRTI